MSPLGSPVMLDAFGPRGEYRTRNRHVIDDMTGVPLAELSLVPPVFITRSMAALRRARTMPVDERVAAVARAGEILCDDTVAGVAPGEYQLLVSRSSGVPIATVRYAVEELRRNMQDIHVVAQWARPTGAVNDWRDPAVRNGAGLWVRKGSVFAVGAAGNYPGVHTGWLEAIALGYRVAVRPSRQEPFTPHRLVAALRLAGLDDDQVVLLPSEYAGADEMMRAADLATVFGGDDVVRRYGDRPNVFLQGPGRSKVLVSADVDWREHLDAIVDSVAGGGGVGCVNATAVLVEGDPRPLAEAIAGRLALLPSLPPEDDKAVLPVQPLARARGLETYLRTVAEGSAAVLGGDGIVDDLGNGSAVMRPAVHVLDAADAAPARVELPFPCVWVAPWSPALGVAPLRDSLVVSVLTHDEALVDALTCEPSIRNVYLGDIPSHWSRPGLPHDGYLGEFLMRSKGVARSS